MYKLHTTLFAAAALCSCVDEPPSSIMGALQAEPELRYAHQPPEAASIRCVDEVCERGTLPTFSNMSDEDIARSEPDLDRAAPGTLRWAQLTDESGEGPASKADLTEQSTRLPGDEMMRFTVRLLEPPDEPLVEDFAFEDGTRREFAAARREACATSQQEIGFVVEQLGGRVLRARWLINALLIEVPAKRVRELLERDDIVSAYASAVDVGNGNDGLERSSAMSTISYRDTLVGTGATGSNHGGQNIVAAVIEVDNPINYTHKAFKTAAGFSRILSDTFCENVWGCSGSANSNWNSHGTAVAGTLLGSVMDNQIPGLTATQEKERSGVAIYADMRYYSFIDGSEGAIEAIEQAVEDGVDLINESHTTPSKPDCTHLCDNSWNPSDWRGELDGAENANVMLAAMIGNCGFIPPCSSHFPGYVPDTIGSAGISSLVNGGPDDSPLGNGSAGGLRATTNRLGEPIDVAVVGLSTFEFVQSVAATGTTGFGSSGGTSFASPVTASLEALTREWLSGFGTVSQSAWANQINVLLMGDGKHGVGAVSDAAVSDRWGYGFAAYFRPDVEHLGSTMGWGVRKIVIHDGETLQWSVGDAGPESTAIQGWKWALALDTNNAMGSYPKLYVRVVDQCAGLAASTVQLAGDDALRYRIILRNPATQIHGRCLNMRVHGTSVPAGGATLWSADMYWSLPTTTHLYVP